MNTLGEAGRKGMELMLSMQDHDGQRSQTVYSEVETADITPEEFVERYTRPMTVFLLTCWHRRRAAGQETDEWS